MSARKPQFKPSKKGPMTLPKPTNYAFGTPTLNRNPLLQASSTNSNSSSGKDPVQVYCRIRPLKSLTEVVVARKQSSNILHISHPSGIKNDLYFSFRNIFSEISTQKEVFMEIAYPLTNDLLNGKNGLLFTYGITSSGKTHTLTGTPQNPGILSRSLDTLFNSIEGRQCRKFTFKPDGQNGFKIRNPVDALLEMQNEKQQQAKQLQITPRTPMKRRNMVIDEFRDWDKREKEYESVQITEENKNLFSVFVSYVEIYNNYIYDLLDDQVFDQIRMRQPQSKILREDQRKKVFVLNGVELEVRNATEANELFIRGLKRRRIAQTALNAESSRSHSVFTIRLVQAPKDRDDEVLLDPKYMTISQLSLVDLAGSERTGRTNTTGDRLKEASSINNSLMALRNCIDILRENQRSTTQSTKLVPYRDNKLTHLFKSYFEGEGKIKMIICLSPGSDDYLETLQVMKFAEAAQEVLLKKATNAPIFVKYDLSSVGNPLHTKWPSTCYQDPMDDRIFPDWMEALDQRRKQKDSLLLSVSERLDAFRVTLCDMEKENMVNKQQLNVHKSDLEVRTFQLKRMEEQVIEQRKQIEAYAARENEFEERIRMLENEISQKDFIISQHEEEVGFIRKNLNEKYDEQYQRLKNEFRKAMREKQAKIERELCLQKEKAEMVREILDGDIAFLRECRDSLCPMSAETVPKTLDLHPLKHQQSTPILAENNVTPKSIRPKFATTQQIFAAYTEGKKKSTVPVSNPRHRRSLSTGNERWIDHKPVGTLELGTVFQPKIKNGKSVSNMSEMSPKKMLSASKYALTHHVATVNGEVETHVYKGEVIPTALGGAQVIFNDVEMLTQSSPKARKRSSSVSHIIGVNEDEEVENNTPAKVLSPNKRNRRI